MAGSSAGRDAHAMSMGDRRPAVSSPASWAVTTWRDASGVRFRREHVEGGQNTYVDLRMTYRGNSEFPHGKHPSSVACGGVASASGLLSKGPVHTGSGGRG